MSETVVVESSRTKYIFHCSNQK